MDRQKLELRLRRLQKELQEWEEVNDLASALEVREDIRMVSRILASLKTEQQKEQKK